MQGSKGVIDQHGDERSRPLQVWKRSNRFHEYVPLFRNALSKLKREASCVVTRLNIHLPSFNMPAGG
jgi:hypothetical protein